MTNNRDMSNKPENPKAFPWHSNDYKPPFDMNMYNEGMTLRDYFAAKAMQMYLSHQGIKRISFSDRIKYLFGKRIKVDLDYNIYGCAQASYEMADEMLKVREQNH
jgi:hypothetical protein